MLPGCSQWFVSFLPHCEYPPVATIPLSLEWDDLNELALSTRAKGVLWNLEIKNLSEITENALRKGVRQCGPKTLAEIMAWRQASLEAGELKRGSSPEPKRVCKKPLLLWEDVPTEHRNIDRLWEKNAPPDSERCKAAAQASYGATPTDIPRCLNTAKQSGLCAYHEKVLREAGKKTV